MAQNFKVELELTNCTANVEENILYTNYDIHVVANAGYDLLSTIPYIEFSSQWGHNTAELDKINDNEYHIEFKAEWLSDISNVVTIHAVATKSTSIKNKYGLITVYNPTVNDLIEISKVRFEEIYSSGDSKYIDTAQYLIALFRLYCRVRTGETERVYFGKYDMQVDCPIVDEDILILNCGDVTISEKYHNSIDYNNTEIEIYLPFIGFVSLKTTDFMNCTVNLKYQVNVINGESLAILSVDDNELMTQNCNISFKIPYTMEDNKKVYSEIDTNYNYLNSLQPFLYIKRSILNDNKVKPFNKSSLYGRIGDFSGYSEIADVRLNIENDYITYKEIEEIKQLLGNGVIL